MQPTDASSDWPEWLTDWPMALAQSRFSAENHGDYPRWQAAIDAMVADAADAAADVAEKWNEQLKDQAQRDIAAVTTDRNGDEQNEQTEVNMDEDKKTSEQTNEVEVVVTPPAQPVSG